MKLICYLLDRSAFDIRPAGLSRDWMDNSIDRFAYRCLPLNIANTHGWEICCEESFEAVWNGGNRLSDIEIRGAERPPAISHFGSGVLTFHVPCVFRTEPGMNLMVMGPPNSPKRGIQALTGVVETDWSPYSFTMNWIFTEPNHVITFAKGEPFCFFFPVAINALNVNPEFCDMRTDPELLLQHTEWIESRQNFLNDLKKPASKAVQNKWQRNYFQGQTVDGKTTSTQHQTKIRVKPFQAMKEKIPS